MDRTAIERDALEKMNRLIERDRLRFGIDEPAASYAIGAAWYGVRTNINCEARVVRGLRRFTVYCPMQTKTIRHARKVEEVKRPLFTGYVFVRIDAARQGFWAVRNCHGVESILGTTGTPGRIKDAVVDELMARQGVGAFDYREKTVVGPKVGDKVKIGGDGMFRDWVAEVAEEADDDRRVGLLLKLFNADRIVKFTLDDLREERRSGGK